ncbi:MAG: choice-of-anchor D domain-containing protein [Bacteroidia bacterium]|nr:choice-of-anchor D domain-containing protein [Bacteroidia bacterium]
MNLARRNAHEPKPLRANEPAPLAFSSVEISYADYPTNIIGETDTTLNNSAGARFYVSQSGGFNLTDARIYLKHDPAKGDAVMEVYRGEKLEKKNLVYAQNFANWSAGETYAYITLNEQIYFEEGETFWLVFHVPHGNLFPLGIGFESDPTYSANCVMSFNLGATWSPLEELINSKDFAWTITAASYNAYLGEYLALEPGSGDISGIGEATTTLTASGAALVNGTYSANVVFTSNDANQRELRKPVELTVSGHQPDIHHIDIVDFGNVFVGTSKELEIELDNAGYGNFNNPSISVSGTEFELSGYAPWQIKAREKAVVKIIFNPTAPGNSNEVLTITNGTQTYEIPLFGVGAETAKIVVTPDVQVKNNLAIGDAVDAQITVRNDGAYPLKYFIPGHDTKGVSNNWPVPFHTYGYAVRTNDPSATDPIAYDFQDISTTGTDITDYFTQPRNWYWDVDMGFEFPYYNDKVTHVYVSKRGFTTFDNTVNPLNTPRLKDFYGPQGYISVLGSHFDYTSQGKIYYQVEPDRVIIQYSNVWDGYSIGEEITAQMVLYADGNIRFFYDYVTFSEQNQHYLTILMEDMAREDGILISDYENFRPLYSQLAIGFDYPGPDIITSVTNGSGIVMPGGEAVVDLSLTTTGLVEGTINRYVSFISNDPSAPQTSARIQLEITSGGISVPLVSLDTVRFGDVFQQAVRAQPFTIRNPGSANVNIVSMAFTNDAFTLGGDPTTATIRPGLYNKYEIQVPTATLGAIEDWLTISYGDGSTNIIYLTANVVDAPSISVDLSQLAQTLNFGETSSHPLTIENTGLASLDVAFTGKNWMTFDVPVSQSSDIPAFTYSVDKSNDGQFYQWLDVRKTGTQMPHVEDFFDKDQFWQQLELPFPIQFYGESYSSFKVGQNGLITLEEETPEVVFFTDYIPSAEHPGKFIMPYWTFGGFDTYTYPRKKSAYSINSSTTKS